MGFKKFLYNIIIRVLLLVLSIYAISFIDFTSRYLYSISFLVGLTVTQTWLLINYIVKQRKDMSRMLAYIKDSNPSIFFSEKQDIPFRELSDFLNEIGDIVRDVRIEKESKLQYLKLLSEHVPVGLLSIDSKGNIDMVNDTGRYIIDLVSNNSTGNIKMIDRHIREKLIKMKPGSREVVNIKRNGSIIRISIRASNFVIGGKTIRLFTFQDISSELDVKEMQAWQKLIRVLNHEIINSVTPMTSLTYTIREILGKQNGDEKQYILPAEKYKKAIQGLEYIGERGSRLIEFVNKYRSLTKIPEPEIKQIQTGDLIKNIIALSEEKAKNQKISIEYDMNPDSPTVFCDPSLTEQVLINIIYNAFESYHKIKQDKPVIGIHSGIDNNGHPYITIRDNGKGIDPRIIDDIFVPFFTTKDEGSGIGLSLSRQIMNMQEGTISVNSTPGKGSTFTLVFRKQSVENFD